MGWEKRRGSGESMRRPLSCAGLHLESDSGGEKDRPQSHLLGAKGDVGVRAGR